MWGFGTSSHTCEFWYQSFTCDDLISIFTHVRIQNRFFTRVSSWYQFFTSEKNCNSSSKVKNTKKCEIWAQILHPKIIEIKLCVNFTLCKSGVMQLVPTHCVRFTKWAVAWDFQECGVWDQQRHRPACTYAQSDQSLCKSFEYFLTVKLLTEHHLKFISFKGGCTGSPESTLVKMSHC